MLAFVTIIQWIVFFGIFIILLSYLVWNTKVIVEHQNLQDSEKISAYECGFLPFSSSRIQFDIKYFVVAILFLLFDLEIAWLFPLAINLDFIGFYGLTLVLKFLLLLFLGLCYEISTNVLNWSYQIQTKTPKLLGILICDYPENVATEINTTIFNEQYWKMLLFSPIIVVLLFLLLVIYCNSKQTQQTYSWQRIITLIYSILVLEFWHILKPTTELFFYNWSFQNPNVLINTSLLCLFFSGIVLKFAFVVLVASNCLFLKIQIKKFQINLLLQVLIICLFFVPVSNELFLTLIALETTNISIYGLLFLFSVNQQLTLQSFKCIEAGLKYFCLSGIFTGIFLGTTLFITILFNNSSLTQIYNSLIETVFLLKNHHVYSIFIMLSLLLFFVFFKLAAFPNHWWAPDVYEGSSLLVFGVLAILLKSAIFCFFCQLFYFIFYSFSANIFFWITTSALGSLLFGAIGAINQKNIKRFLAYTSMHHMGFIFICYNNCATSLSSVVFYFFSYLLSLTIFYLCYNSITKTNKLKSLTYISELNKIASLKFPVFALILILSLASMGGFPPLVGFFGKYFIFNDLIANWNMYFFAVVVFTSIISAYNYLKVITSLLFCQKQHNLYNFLFLQILKSKQFVLTSHFIALKKFPQGFLLLIQIGFLLFQKNIDRVLVILMLFSTTLMLFPSQDWIIFKNFF